MKGRGGEGRGGEEERGGEGLYCGRGIEGRREIIMIKVRYKEDRTVMGHVYKV